MHRLLLAIVVAAGLLVLVSAQSSAPVACVVTFDAKGHMRSREPVGCWRLMDSSPYKNAGTDGKDLGADIAAVERATCGVVEGRPCEPNPPAAVPSPPRNPRIIRP